MHLTYPFSLISGNGLGISYSSLTQIGPALPSRGFGVLKMQSFINVKTGNLIIFDHQLIVQEPNFPLEFYYVYNSQAQTVADIWRFAHKRFKFLPKPDQTSSAILIEKDGHETCYAFDSQTKRWVAPYWSESRPYLVYDKNQKQWVWFDPKTQITEIYNEQGYLEERFDCRNERTSYEYDDFQTPWKLTKILAPESNYEFHQQIINDNCFESIFQINAGSPTLLRTSVFDQNGRLIQTILPAERTPEAKRPQLNFVYRAPSMDPAKVHDDDVYNLAYLDIVKQTDADASNISFMFDAPLTDAPRKITSVYLDHPPLHTSGYLLRFSYHQNYADVVSNAGVASKIYFNQQGSIIQIDQEQGYPNTTYNPIDSCFYTYTNHGQLASITSAGQATQSFQYEARDGLLIKQQKANGQITEYVYDEVNPRHNLIAQIHYVKAKAQTTRKVYDQAFSSYRGLYLRFEISPEGRVTEYRYENYGYLKDTIIYLQGRFPVERYAKNAVPNLAEMASWVAQQDLQQISLTERHYYDGSERRQTYYYGTINKQGKGVADDKMSEVITHYARCALIYKREYPKKSANPLETFFEYDSACRLLSHKNPTGEITRYRYDNSHIEITRPNNRKEMTEFDACEMVSKETQTIPYNDKLITRETSYSRNITGTCTEKCTSADGQLSYRFYDKQNRLGITVASNGRLTEYHYDAQNRNKITLVYAKTIDVKKIESLGFLHKETNVMDLLRLMKEMAIADPKRDHVSYEFYDHSGRLSYQVDAENYYRQTLYNDRDAVIAEIQYASPLKPEQLAVLLKGETLDSQIDLKRDRIQRKFYDADQQLIGTQDAAGYVIEYKHNGAGWITEVIRYAQAQIISTTTQNFDKIRPVANAEDAHHYFFYNPRGWVTSSIDAEGYITAKDYSLNGLVSRETRYANPVDAAWYHYSPLIPPVPVRSVNDQIIDYEYDALNREIESRQSDGKVTFTRYDNMGEIIAKGARDAAATEISGDSYRANETRFDAWGQMLAEASAQNSELLARIDADSTLKPEEKQQQKEKIWSGNTRRHVYDASGLKLSTAVRATPDASDQLTYFYYNAERQLILTLQVVADKQVQIREYKRDTFNNIVQIRDYSQDKATLADKFNHPLTGGFIPDALHTALDALQDDTQDVITQKFYNKRDEAIKLVDAEGFETQHTPNAFNEIGQSSLPVQTKQPTLVIQRQYDARGLEISTLRQAETLNSKVKRDYSNHYGKLTHLRDELKGDYQRGYDRKGRLIWTQNPLQQQRSNISYNAWDKPTKMTNALGLSTQHLYDLNHRTETIVDPLGNKRSIIRNIFAEKIQEIDANQQIQTWQHSADGQISRYMDALGRGYAAVYNLLGSLTERQILNGIKTQYFYDAIGRLISQIQDADDLKLKTQHQYNLLGDCVKTIDEKGIIQENKYDRRGLIIEECLDAQASGLNLTATRQYNGQKQLLSEIQGNKAVADQYTRQLDYDGLNRHCKTIIDPITGSHQAGLNIQTQQHKNAQNSVLAEIDANGQVIRFIIDTAGRRCFKINPLGGVTEWKYNAADQIILERQYEKAISENEVTPINDDTTPEQLRAMLKPNSEDTLTYQFYDANGKQRFALSCNDQKAYIKEKRYDAMQREIQTIQYATGIAIQGIEKLTTKQLAAQVLKIANPTQDRCHYFLRDEVGQCRFSIDPQNYVCEQRFDEQGHIISQIAYANPIEDALTLSQLPIAQLLAQIKQDESQDRYQFFFFDSLGQPLYTVNAEGQVQGFQHDAKGNLTEEVHFNQRLNVPQDYVLLLQQLQSLKPDTTQDRISKKVYDAANRLIQHTDALGYVETYQYDALGNRIIYTDRQQSIWKTVFDRAKRPIIEITTPVNITEVTPDAFGSLTAASQIIGIEKHKVYDKVGNIARIITAANTQEPRIFEAEYNGLNQWQLTRLPDIAIDNGTTLRPDEWRYRPESKQTLTTARTFNAKGLKVAEQDAAGHWQYWVYDQQQRLVYHVNSLGVTTKKQRDAFGKIHRKIINATLCTLDLSVYSKTGIPKSVLDEYYRTRHTDADRIIDYQRDQCGRIILQRQGPVHCYVSTPIGKINEEYAELRKSYNAWGQVIAQTEKIDSTLSKENFYWFDRNGRRLAEVNSVGFDNQTSQYRCQRFENDSFGQMIKRVAYAKSLDTSLNAHLSFAELKNALDKIASTQDRSEQSYYDKANRLVKKVRLQVLRQTLQLTAGIPSFIDASPQDLSVSYQYNANGQMIAKTLEDGSVEWSFYDARGCKLAQTDVPRDNAGHSNVIIPLTYYGNNAHGQTVLTIRFQQGAKPVKAGSIPEPVAVDPADQQEQRLYDARGKLQWKQSNQQLPQGFSYTANGKPARQWWTLTNWEQKTPKEGTQYEAKIHLDEKYFQYDAQNRAISIEVRRDTQTVETNCIAYDAFDQAIMEGEKPEKMPIYRRFDQLGRLWSTNAEKGIPTITLYDLTGQSILRLQSPSKDLGIISYREIPSLLDWDINDLERTENQRDIAGCIITRSLPANYQVDTTQPEIIPLSILASNRYPNLGKIQSLSWPVPQERNAVAEFSLWPKDMPALKQSLPIITQDGRCGVDVSSLATDVYDYQVAYTFTDPIKNEKKQVYISSGTLQFDTGNSTHSHHLVPLTEAKQTSLVRLTGNTSDISAVELWDEIGKRETLELQIDPVSHTYYVDLSHHSSGVYQLKPLTQDKKPHDLSLAFTIYTNKTAHKPLSRELATSLKLSFLDNHVELDWQVPHFLQSQVVKLECHYLDRQAKQQSETLEINPDQKRTTYSDKKGNKIQSNIDFSIPIQTIEKLSLAVQWPALSKPPAITRLQQHWLMLVAENSETSDEEWEMLPAHAKFSLEKELEEWIPLYSNEIPSASAFDPELITELNFTDKTQLLVSPVPDITPDKEIPTLEYLNVSLDRMRCWTQFSSISLITQGFVVDMTGFSAGVYPFRFAAYSGDLVLSYAGLVFPTTQNIDPDRQQLVQPARQYSYDLWNNKLTETDTLGHTTHYQYNDANQLIQKQEPLVDVVDEQGISKALCPITTFAYNVRGQQIARRDANGNTHAYILDTAGHKIIEILAEGTQRKTQLFDAFNNMIESRDAENQATIYFYDQANNLLAFQKPSGSRRSYTYNELKQRNSDADPANNTRRYNFDVLGNIIERYEPLGQCTRMVYGRNHQLIKVENPDNSCLTWQRDTFGKPLQHTDLSGALYHYGYDSKAQLVDVMSEGGDHGECVKLIPAWLGYKQERSPVPEQHLHYQYVSGQITEINDFASGKKISYGYDSEGRRIAVRVVSGEAEILRETSSQIDALGREILTRDQQAIFTTAYDAVSNRRFIKGVIKTSDGSQLNQEVWWKYDSEDRVIISEGILADGKITIVQDKGMEFTYKNDRRVTESEFKYNKSITATLFYDSDGRLIGSNYGKYEKIERQYDNAGRQKLYKNTSILPFGLVRIDEKLRDCNENTWLIANIQTTTVPGHFQIVNRTDYQQITAMGLPQQQTINYGDEAGNVDHLNCNYVGWDQWRIASIQGYRTNIHGTSAYSSVKNYLGPNGEPNAICGAEDPDGRDKYFIATPEGLILRRMHLGPLFSSDIFISTLETYYFYRVNGQYLASYKKNPRNKSFDLLLNWIRPQGSAGMEIGMSSAITNDFSSLPQTYTCADKDTYESIANNVYGDASLGSYIDAANGGGTLIPGQTIVIPQLISVHNKAGMARPYYQLLQIIQGSLTPHLDTPQPPPDDDDFFGFLVKAIVVVVICVAAPEVAPGFVASLTATFGTAGALAVGAGLADAAAQGLCIGLGMQNNFSMAELATTMIAAGLGAQLTPLAAGANSAQLMEFIVRAGAVNVEEQLAEMAIGIRQQLDIAGVALAMGSAGLSSEIKITNPLERRLVADVGTAVMSGVVRGRFDAENLAAQLITDTASYLAQQQTKSVSDEYHQSKMASQGAGHITQTTIEQQWESQLINDAEFMANTQLPSVTFDINNSDISQQLGQRVGEEVSHFYHPTPPPARNANGFWQRIEQRYENVFEHRALIAEGRAAANSEVMSESLGHAAVNQQNYLDIGFSESVAQTRSAEWTGLSEFPFIIPETGIATKLGNKLLQVSKLANKWGFFGHNEIENSELFFNQFPDHEVYNSRTISLAQLKNINGKWNYVINSDGKLIVGKSGQFPGGGHIDLSNGQPIKAAGEVKIVNGQLKYIDNSSGHYLPSGLSARQIAEETFSKLGFDTLNKYIEKKWIEDSTIRNGGAWRPNL